MDVSEIQAAVKNQFGDLSGAVITDTDIIRWANAAQLDIVRQTEELTTTDDTTVTVVGQEEYALPTDFMFPHRVTHDGARLRMITLQELDSMAPNRGVSGGNGTPEYYYIWGDKLNLWPAPDSAGKVVKIWYTKEPAELTASGDVPELPTYLHEDIVRYCLMRAKEKDDDFEAAQEVRSDLEMRLSETRQNEDSRSAESYPSVRTLPGDEGYIDGYY